MIALSDEQTLIARWVDKGRGNALVIARAGTGKTFLIRQCLPLMRGSRAIGAYNSDIAAEIRAKVAEDGNRGVDTATFHSFGFRALRKMYPNAKMEGRGPKDVGYSKFERICTDLDIPDYLHRYVERAMDLGMQRGFGVICPLNDPKLWTDLNSHYDLDADLPDQHIAIQLHGRDGVIKMALQYAAKAINHGIKLADEVYSFGDMLYLPLVKRAKLDQFDWVCVDEAQDTNPLRREMARRMLKPNGRMMYVGDNCQPLGTKVLVPSGPQKRGTTDGKHGALAVGTQLVNIEDLVVGDKVVSYEPDDCAFVKGGRSVNGITRRPYVGDLIVVETEDGDASRYTPNHICLVNFSELRDKWAVYAMRRGDQFRIGKCAMTYAAHSGLSARMHNEKAEAAWILAVYDTENEAYFAEQAIGGRFGLPQLMFSAKKMTRGPSAEYLPRAWGFIGSNFERGVRCLAHFGRDPWHPLFERGTGKQQTIKRPILTRASNLMTGVKVLPYGAGNGVHVKSSDWKTVIVSTEWYEGDVISLDVGGSKLYVADNIVTHNCQSIYGFTGADNDALEQIRDQFHCTVLKMTTTFRCSQAVAALAAQIVPDYKAAPSNPQGSVTSLKEAEFDKLPLLDTDAIICRNVKPLVTMAYKLLGRDIPCRVRGRDIGRGMLDLIKRFPHIKTIPALEDKLEEYKEREHAKLMAAQKEMQADALLDKVETLVLIMKKGPKGETVRQLEDRITALFTEPKDGSERKCVSLMTAHSSKGREFSRVFGLGVAKYMPSPHAKKDWTRVQETNLEYVLKTRAITDYVDIVMP